MTTNTASLDLAAFITHATGYDPLAPEHAADFAIRDDLPCGSCETVTATALLDMDGEGAERLCLTCA